MNKLENGSRVMSMCMEEMESGERNMEEKMLEFCDELELCVANTWFRKGKKRKVTFSAWGNESEIDFVLVEKGNRKYLRDMKVIPGELQHSWVVVDLVKKKVKKVGRKEAIERRKVWKLIKKIHGQDLKKE